MADVDDPDEGEGAARPAAGLDAGELGVAEALRAWEQGGHADAHGDDGEVSPIQFPQLEAGVPNVKPRLSRLNNVRVSISVELGRTEKTVRELTQLREQDIIDLPKLAGEPFEIRVNGRAFAQGEVVVLAEMVAVRITQLLPQRDQAAPDEDEE